MFELLRHCRLLHPLDGAQMISDYLDTKFMNILFYQKFRLTLISLSLSCLIILWPADSLPVCGQLSEDAPATAALILRQHRVLPMLAWIRDLFNSRTPPHLMESWVYRPRLRFPHREETPVSLTVFFVASHSLALSISLSYKVRMTFSQTMKWEARFLKRFKSWRNNFPGKSSAIFLIGASRYFTTSKMLHTQKQTVFFCVNELKFIAKLTILLLFIELQK